MKHLLWKGFKFLIPLGAVVYVAQKLLALMQDFWSPLIFGHLGIAGVQPWSALLSIVATITLLWLTGYLLEMSFVKKIFAYLVSWFPILSYIWSGEEKEELEKTGPVLFCNPINGEWKLGFITGMQKTTDGREFHRVYYFTGIGDHVFIEKGKEELIIRLANPPQELAKFIGSFMTSGPEYLIVKNVTPKKPSKDS